MAPIFVMWREPRKFFFKQPKRCFFKQENGSLQHSFLLHDPSVLVLCVCCFAAFFADACCADACHPFSPLGPALPARLFVFWLGVKFEWHGVLSRCGQLSVFRNSHSGSFFHFIFALTISQPAKFKTPLSPVSLTALLILLITW